MTCCGESTPACDGLDGGGPGYLYALVQDPFPQIRRYRIGLDRFWLGAVVPASPY
jgi:hypothetical protein